MSSKCSFSYLPETMRYSCTRSGAFTLKSSVMVKIYVDLACLRPGKKGKNCCVPMWVCVCVCNFLTAVAHP